ncbi:MAG: response regulator transcription factor [Beijerinckiaceae bacterium]|jgi:two-component system OmpR family response regulator
MVPGVSENPQKIILYEDDLALAREIVRAFAEQDYDVHVAGTEADVLHAAYGEAPCILIMDRMIHNDDSLTIVETLRSSRNHTPVIIISSLSSVDDRVHGLKTGGDDYLIKPFSMGELIARVEALMRRTADAKETRLVVGDLVMELIDRTVRRGSRILTLAPREFSLLEYFMRRPDQIITRAMILENVWKYRAPLQTNVVDVHISTLRRKVSTEDEIQMIRNKRGLGFIITASHE